MQGLWGETFQTRKGWYIGVAILSHLHTALLRSSLYGSTLIVWPKRKDWLPAFLHLYNPLGTDLCLLQLLAWFAIIDKCPTASYHGISFIPALKAVWFFVLSWKQELLRTTHRNVGAVSLHVCFTVWIWYQVLWQRHSIRDRSVQRAPSLLTKMLPV